MCYNLKAPSHFQGHRKSIDLEILNHLLTDLLILSTINMMPFSFQSALPIHCVRLREILKYSKNRNTFGEAFQN